MLRSFFLLAAIACLVAPSAHAAGQLQIVAHEDDDLYFMTPAISDAIALGQASWTVYLTAGDAGRTNGHWQSRELGIRAAYAQMAAQPNSWTAAPVTVNGRSLTAFQLDAAPQIIVVFMRLPDGNPNGTGYAVTGNESLRYVWEGAAGTLIHSLDGAHQYTRQELADTLAALIQDRAPDTLRIQDMTSYHGSDHSDHYHSGRFAFQAHLANTRSYRLRAYRAYNIDTQPVNLSPDEISDSNSIITTYGAFDPGVGPTGWNQREIPIADVGPTQASLVLMGTPLGDVCLAVRDPGTPVESLVFETCADIAAQAFNLTARNIRHGSDCLVSPALGGSPGSLGFAPCGTTTGEGWTFFTDGHARGIDDTCFGEVSGVPALEPCSGASREWEVSAKPPIDAGIGSAFSTIEFGTDPARYESLEFGDLDGDGLDDTCARRADGVYCAQAIGSGFFGAAQLWHANYGDDDAWAPVEHSTTLQLGDIDGDGLADLCGRGSAGLLCVRSNGSSFVDFRLWTSTFSNADGGAQQETYGSIRLGDVNGDGRADVCAYRNGQIECALSNGTQFGAPTVWMTQSWITLLGLPSEQIAQSMLLGDVDGDGDDDLCERGSAGVYCAMAEPLVTLFINPAMRSQGEFSDALGWSGADSYWGSLRLGDFSGDGQADLCGRGGAGALCLYSMDGRFSARNHLLSDEFSNASGYLPTELGSTFSMADIDGDGHSDLCAAGPTTLRCAVLDDPVSVPEPSLALAALTGMATLFALRRRRR